METGNLKKIYKTYKHALINQINLEQCTLSIRFLPDGLSLFIYQENEEKIWYSLSLQSFSKEGVLSDLQQIWRDEELLQNTFKNAQIYFQSMYSIWVPSTFFAPNKLNDLVALQIPYESQSQSLFYDFHFKWDAYHVYAVNNELIEFCKKNIAGNVTFFNDMMFSFNRSKLVKSIQKKVFFSQDNDLVDVWMIEGSKLIFHKSFLPTENENELAFRLFSILDVVDFDYVDDLFYCVSPISDTFYSLLYTYIKSIQRIDIELQIKFSLKELKKIPDYKSLLRILE